MNAQMLKKHIDSLASHILFDYNSIPCGIDPINRHNIDIWYGNNAYTAKSIDDAMSFPLFESEYQTV